MDGDSADDDLLAGVVLSDLLLEAAELLFGLSDFLFERERHSPSPRCLKLGCLQGWRVGARSWKCAVIQTAKLFVRSPPGALPRRTAPPRRCELCTAARAAHPGPGQRRGAGPR